MEHFGVFYGIFREDMPLLLSGFLPRGKYLTFLKRYYPYVFTHLSMVVKKRSECSFTVLKNSETPFYTYESSLKEGFKNTLLTEINPNLLSFLLDHISVQQSNIQEVHIRETEERYIVDIFINRSYTTLSNTALCYYYYFILLRPTYNDFTEYLHQLYFDESISEEKRESKIRKYQLKLNYYIATLEKTYLTDTSQNVSLHKGIQDVFRCMHRYLDRILIYMEECCDTYLDKELGVSYEQRRQFISTYYDVSQELIVLFKQQKLPKEIELELCKPLYKITSDTFTPLTYIKREFYRKYIDLFTRLFTKLESPDHDQVYSLMIALDLNTHNVGKAMSIELLHRLEDFSTPTEQQTYLYRQLMRVEEVPVTSPISYHPEFPSLKTYLISYIRQRIALSHQTYEIEQINTKKIPSSDMGIVNITKSKVVKRKVNLTIPELALFARLFTEIKVVSVKGNKQQYFKFLSQIYMSKDDKDISENSVKNAFYSSSKDTLASVERLLIRMLNTIQKFKDSKMIS
ncbi:hypothetical protein FOF46_30360 [Aquimarina algiphila]|uniref:Uncharacterized protein n=2 Tax=Aquimarina algiphila TaxID=2047982 RepID=A0A554VAB9_9FLAO|nr:hypothetical protein [Aquimarina algiphila]TSE02880.1 hypothetical protein FOF46_30360 [Aquimarina algiphila]